MSSLLQTLAFLAMVLAWAHPQWSNPARHIAILLDCSASMQTRVGETSVFDRAIHKTTDLLGRLSSDDEITLHLYPPYTIHKGTPSQIMSLLANLNPSQQSARFENLLENLARSSPVPIYFVTDGAGIADLPDIVEIQCGEKATDNVGFIVFHIQPEGEELHRIFAAIRNFSSRTASANLTLTAGEKQYFQQIDLSPGGRYYFSEEMAIPSEIICLKLDAVDNFSLDNEVAAVKSPATSLWIPPDASAALRAVCNSIPGLCIESDARQADVCFAPLHSHYNAGEGWLTYRRGFDPKSLSVMVPGQRSPYLWTADSLLDSVYPELIEIPEAAAVLKPPLPEGAKVLLDSSEGPVMAYGPDWLFIGFSPMRSNWPDLPSFPIFWYNFFEHISPDRGHFIYRTTEDRHPEIGLHRDESQHSVAVNLLSELESDNEGGQTGNIPWPSPVASEAQKDLRPWLVLVSTLLLVIIWRPRNL